MGEQNLGFVFNGHQQLDENGTSRKNRSGWNDEDTSKVLSGWN